MLSESVTISANADKDVSFSVHPFNGNVRIWISSRIEHQHRSEYAGVYLSLDQLIQLHAAIDAYLNPPKDETQPGAVLAGKAPEEWEPEHA